VSSSIDAAVARRVQRAAPGTVFTPALFAKTGSRAAVDKALQRMVERGASMFLTAPPPFDAVLAQPAAAQQALNGQQTR
jgi:hypothetical protein